MSDEAAYSQDEFGDPHGLPWRVAPWGDGSSTTGNSNIISDRWQVVIASEMPTATAEFIVASVNQIERLRAALRDLINIPAVRQVLGERHTADCGCPLCRSRAALSPLPSPSKGE